MDSSNEAAALYHEFWCRRRIIEFQIAAWPIMIVHISSLQIFQMLLDTSYGHVVSSLFFYSWWWHFV
jgi:hypothetical protein